VEFHVRDEGLLSEVYNYELTVPLSLAKDLYDMMLVELNRALPFKGRLVKIGDKWVFEVVDGAG
jgi:hypothetical protein